VKKNKLKSQINYSYLERSLNHKNGQTIFTKFRPTCVMDLSIPIRFSTSNSTKVSRNVFNWILIHSPKENTAAQRAELARSLELERPLYLSHTLLMHYQIFNSLSPHKNYRTYATRLCIVAIS
jgi:hypothetical protein